MEDRRFDTVVKAFGIGATRRGVLGGALTGVLAAVLGAPEAEARRKHGTKEVQTASQPRSCDIECSGLKAQAKTACKKACRECGGNFDQVCIKFGPVGPTAFTCCPEGTACSFETSTCVEVATCPSGEPAEACSLGITTNCGAEGACALVVNADGGCACVERTCTDIVCTTGADCESGLCVNIPGCCPDTQVCAVPCGASAATSRTTRWGER